MEEQKDIKHSRRSNYVPSDIIHNRLNSILSELLAIHKRIDELSQKNNTHLSHIDATCHKILNRPWWKRILG